MPITQREPQQRGVALGACRTASLASVVRGVARRARSRDRRASGRRSAGGLASRGRVRAASSCVARALEGALAGRRRACPRRGRCGTPRAPARRRRSRVVARVLGAPTRARARSRASSIAPAARTSRSAGRPRTGRRGRAARSTPTARRSAGRSTRTKASAFSPRVTLMSGRSSSHDSPSPATCAGAGARRARSPARSRSAAACPAAAAACPSRAARPPTAWCRRGRPARPA